MLCNICDAKASSHCSKCKKRVYCSRECQRSDYKIHKQYCRPPITDRDRLKELEVLYKSLRTPPPFGVAVYAPDSVVASISNLERTFWTTIVPEWPVVPYKEWPGLFEGSSGIGKELEALPRPSPFAGGGGQWIVSFCNFGIMDANGRLLYNLVCHDTASHPSTVRCRVLSKGTPTIADLEQCFHQSAARPLEGDPHTPATMLLANRWVKALGSDAVAKFSDMLHKELNVLVRVETRSEAEMSAANNDTDPDGNNFDFVEYNPPVTL